MKKLLYLLIGCSVLACSSPSKLLEKGRYDDALWKSLNKLNKTSDSELIDVATIAFDRLQSYDYSEYNRLSQSPDNRKYEQMHSIALKIERRQRMVQSYLPIYDEYGELAHFDMLPIEQMLRTSAIGAAQFYYDRGHKQLAVYDRDENKVYARRAHSDFLETKRFMSIYKDTDSWIQKTLEWGTYHVYVDVAEYTGSIAGDYVRRTLLDELGLDRSELKWVDIHTFARPAHVDFKVEIALEQADISPDVLREFNNEYVEYIEDGEEFLLNENGDYVIDSSGVRVTVPREVKVRAELTKVEQIKEARISGEIRIMDIRKNRWVDRQNITADSYWENISCRWTGDRRALPQDIPRVGRPVQFPDDQSLIDDLLFKLTPTIRDYIQSRSWDGIS